VNPAQAATEYFLPHRYTSFPVIDDVGRTIGLVSVTQMEALTSRQRTTQRVDEIADRDTQQIKRRIGLKRPPGTRDGLTLGQAEAEAELRSLIADVKPTRQAGDVLTMAELGQRYLGYLERQGRKKATTTAVESILRVWLEPFFGERDLRGVRAEDVDDLIIMMEKGDRQKDDRRYGRPVLARSAGNYAGELWCQTDDRRCEGA
jgi:hypothetical protein